MSKSNIPQMEKMNAGFADGGNARPLERFDPELGIQLAWCPLLLSKYTTMYASGWGGQSMSHEASGPNDVCFSSNLLLYSFHPFCSSSFSFCSYGARALVLLPLLLLRLLLLLL